MLSHEIDDLDGIPDDGDCLTAEELEENHKWEELRRGYDDEAR